MILKKEMSLCRYLLSLSHVKMTGHTTVYLEVDAYEKAHSTVKMSVYKAVDKNYDQIFIPY